MKPCPQQLSSCAPAASLWLHDNNTAVCYSTAAPFYSCTSHPASSCLCFSSRLYFFMHLPSFPPHPFAEREREIESKRKRECNREWEREKEREREAVTCITLVGTVCKLPCTVKNKKTLLNMSNTHKKLWNSHRISISFLASYQDPFASKEVKRCPAVLTLLDFFKERQIKKTNIRNIGVSISQTRAVCSVDAEIH